MSRSSKSSASKQREELELKRIPGFAPKAQSEHLERTIHERMRLGILSALAVNDGLDFSALKELLNATDGNLSIHARKLEEARYISCKKTFDGRTPRSVYKLTAAGRRALKRYLDHMEALIRAVRDDG